MYPVCPVYKWCSSPFKFLPVHYNTTFIFSVHLHTYIILREQTYYVKKNSELKRFYNINTSTNRIRGCGYGTCIVDWKTYSVWLNVTIKHENNSIFFVSLKTGWGCTVLKSFTPSIGSDIAHCCLIKLSSLFPRRL